MAITVKHTKVSTIPDGDDTSVVRPSDWNADHQLVGTIPVANGGTGAATLTGYVKGNGTSTMTASSTIPNTDITGLGTASTKDAGVANGVATLDGSGTVPVSQLPAAVLGALSYQGTWNATTNTPTLTSSVGTKGYYYVVSVAGTTNLNGITDWQIGDWAVFNGTAWQKIDNTDAVTSVNGYTGTVVLTNTDISGFGTMSTQNANSVAITGGAINGTTIGATTQADITGNTISAFTKFVATDYYAQSITGGNLRTSGGTSLVNWDGGGSGNVTINGGLLANPANKNVSIAPTGTGTATINPATAGTINNMVIGGTTPLAGSFTDLSVTGTTKFDGSEGTSGQVLTSAGAGNTPTWTTPTTGTVTSVTATAPVASTGGTTPVISMPAATTSVSGYLTSTDWNTFNGKSNTNGTVTSVAALTLGTTGTDLSSTVATGTTTPVITLQVPTASATNRGALSSTDWSTFNGKQAALVSGTNIKTVNGTSLLGSGDVPVGVLTVTGTAPVVSSGGANPAISMAAANTTTNGYLTSTDWNTFNGKGSGTVTSVAATAGTGISVTGSPITTTGTLNITNTGVTSIVAGTGISISGSTGAVTITNSVASVATPQITNYSSGSGTYTTPANAKYLIVEMVGGGGGGSGGGTGSFGVGGNGGNTTFGSNSANAGSGGPAPWSGTGGAGGAITVATGTSMGAFVGAIGGGSAFIAAGNINYTVAGGMGGSSFYGGAGPGATYVGGGGAAKGNTGSGGGGGGTGNDVSVCYSGTGGGAGGFIKVMITSPSATYSYAVGAGGSGGAAGSGSNAPTGGAGGSGWIQVTAYF
jgi:hypothetical protein